MNIVVPPLTAEAVSPEGLRWTFCAPGLESVFYGGHFPGHPILPGVVALSWMVAAVERFLGKPIVAPELLNVKFQLVVTPGAALELIVVPQAGGRIRAALTSAGGVHASVLIPPQEA